ncbi:MAG TPA: hypothetical protein VHY21_23795, partial [Pseudonocardiaceae bacterium]|nr:hypothetical protein [Pseudonocardiaceae bacterium]
HGLVQRAKLGVDLTPEGVEVCRGCHKPTWESAVRANPPASGAPKLSEIMVVTMNDIPGYQIDEVLARIFHRSGVGDRFGGGFVVVG